MGILCLVLVLLFTILRILVLQSSWWGIKRELNDSFISLCKTCDPRAGPVLASDNLKKKLVKPQLHCHDFGPRQSYDSPRFVKSGCIGMILSSAVAPS